MMADLLLYRRMRGVFWGLLVGAVLGLTLATMVAITVPAQLGWYDASAINDLGGPNSAAEGGYGILSVLASLAAVILGATAGSVDQQRGVLRDLVIAGRPRWRIVMGRVVAAAGWLLVIAAVGAAIVIAFSVALPPVSGSFRWSEGARTGLAYLPTIVASLAVSCGLALLIGSRGMAIAVFFVVSLIVDNVLRALPKVGDWWEHVSFSAADAQVHAWIQGIDGAPTDRSNVAALVVLVAWPVVALGLGIARLSRRDL